MAVQELRNCLKVRGPLSEKHRFPASTVKVSLISDRNLELHSMWTLQKMTNQSVVTNSKLQPASINSPHIKRAIVCNNLWCLRPPI